MPDKLDTELEALVGRLNMVVQATGAAEVQTVDPTAGMDDFSRAKFAVEQCLQKMESALPQIEQNAAEIRTVEAVEQNQQFQSNEAQANQIWAELDALHQKELSKKHSKVKDLLPERTEAVRNLRTEIDRLRDARRTIMNPAFRANRRPVTQMADSELFKAGAKDEPVAPTGYAPGSKRHNNMTDEERQQLQALKARDNELDEKYLNKIGEGLDYLQEKAEGFGERLREHDQKIDEIQTKTDEVTEKLVNVNAQLKETLNSVRGSDKICMDIMCILAMLGLLGVLIQMLTNTDE